MYSYWYTYFVASVTLANSKQEIFIPVARHHVRIDFILELLYILFLKQNF